MERDQVQNTVRLAGVLFTICAVTSGLLAWVDSVTAERIEENERKEAARLRAEALVGPGTPVEFGEPKQIGDLECYAGRIDGTPVGTVFTVTTRKGYGDPIEIIIGVDPTGSRITGVRIKKHAETPGLGARIAEVKPGGNEPWFLSQFKNLTADKIRLRPKGEIDAITAATIPSAAVTDAVREGFDKFTSAKEAQRGRL